MSPLVGVVLALFAVGGAILFVEWVARTVVRPPRLPVGRTPADLGLEHDDVVIAADHRLRGWLLRPAADRGGPVVVLSHGWGANAAVLLGLAAKLVEAGRPVLLFDFRAHGRSEDAPYVTARQYRDDLEAAASWMVRRFPGRPLVLAGHSMGGAAAVLAVADGVEAAGVVLVAVPADVLEVTGMYIRERGLPGGLLVLLCRPSFRLRAKVPYRRLVPERRIPEVDVPLLILQPERDRRVPREHAERLARAAGTEARIIEGASHTDVLERPETVRRVLDFIDGLNGDAGGAPRPPGSREAAGR